MGGRLPDEGGTSAGSHHRARICLCTQEEEMGFLAKGTSPAEAQSQKWPCSQHITENYLIRRQCSETGGHRLSSQVGRAQGLKNQTEGMRMDVAKKQGAKQALQQGRAMVT